MLQSHERYVRFLCSWNCFLYCLILIYQYSIQLSFSWKIKARKKNVKKKELGKNCIKYYIIEYHIDKEHKNENVILKFYSLLHY